MDIEKQVEVIMQGTDYGDEELKNAMAAELLDAAFLAAGRGHRFRAFLHPPVPAPSAAIQETPRSRRRRLHGRGGSLSAAGRHVS